jgi:hypothetical protein
MVPVAGWSWCHRCGHRAVGQPELVPAQTPAAARKSRAGDSELALAARLIPLWCWVLLGGLAAIAGVSWAADFYLPARSWERAFWSAAQVFLGLFSLLLAGVCVSGQLGRHRNEFTLADLLLPDRLWPRALKCLPQTRWHVCAGAWSAAVALCGLVWVGGWTYWLPTRPAPSPTRTGVGKYLREAAGKKDEDAEPREEAAPDAQAQGSSATPAERTESAEEPARPKRSVRQYVIVGYTVKEGVVRLLTATAEGDELRYAGEVPLGEDKALQKDLLARFASLKSGTALFPDLDVKAVWLRPRLSCEVEAEGLKDQLLKAPRFLNLVFPKKPQPVRLPPAEDAEADEATSAKSDSSR